MKIALSLCTLLIWFGCAPLDDTTSVLSAKGGKSEIYPVSTNVHFGDPRYTDGELGQVSATVSNAFAYARYAVEHFDDVDRADDAYTIAMTMAREAEQGIPYETAAQLSLVGAASADYERVLLHIKADARQLNSETLPRQGRDIADGYARLRTCESLGYETKDCCGSLLWIEGFRADNDHLEEASYEIQTRHTLDKMSMEAGGMDNVHPFRQAGIRSWLAYCAPQLTAAPTSLDEFKAEFGDYHQHSEWTREFHPLSAAKQAGRRIFRRQLYDGTKVSVAESTRDDCSILETEIIVKRPLRQAEFWVFEGNGIRGDHAFFPTRRANEDAVKFAPSTCMGCHYTLDTREFKVVAPSFSALNLKLYESNGEHAWRDHTYCSEPNETVIYHDLFALIEEG